MYKQWAAVVVLLVGLTGFLAMEAAHNTEAFSPQFASRPLQGRIVGVDAGHGGYDGGCEGASGGGPAAAAGAGANGRDGGDVPYGGRGAHRP